MKKIIFSIIVLLCIVIGFVQFRNIKEIASNVLLSRTEITPVIAIQDILPANIADESSVSIDSSFNTHKRGDSTLTYGSNNSNTRAQASENEFEAYKIDSTSSEKNIDSRNHTSPKLPQVNNAEVVTTDLNTYESSSKNIAKTVSIKADVNNSSENANIVIPQPQRNNQKENNKATTSKDLSSQVTKNTTPESVKNNNTPSITLETKEKTVSNVTMYASVLTPKSNDNTEIIKAYINEKLVPNDSKNTSILRENDQTSSEVVVIEKLKSVDTIMAVALPKVATVTASSKPLILKAKDKESNNQTSLSETMLLANMSPNISYDNQQNYPVGKQIFPLVPVNIGSAIPATIYGHVSTIAGGGPNGDSGSKNGLSLSARFYYPYSTVIDVKGDIYVADQGNSLIRKITASGVVSTLAGSGFAGFADGVGTAASFSNPKGIAVDTAGNVYVADAVNNRIRKISSKGVVTTLAGNGTSGFIDGLGTQASFYNPSAIAVDAIGNVYVADEKNHSIRKITPLGEVNTLAGNGVSGSIDGNGAEASFNYPSGIALDNSGNVYVADFSNHKIRKITPGGLVSTLAGSGSIGRANGLGTLASFHNPTGISVDKAGNVYVADAGNHQIRKINTQGTVSTLPCTESEGSISNLATNTGFYNPSSVITDGKGSIYVTDQNNNRIRRVGVTGYTISPALPSGLLFDSSTGIISGTPEIASELTEYTITAYNSIGSSITNLKIATLNPTIAASASYPTQ